MAPYLFLDIQFKVPFDKLIHKLESWLDFVILKTPNIILGTFVLLFFIVLSKVIGRGVGKLADKITDRHNLKYLIKKFFLFFIQLIGVFAALNIIGLDKTVTSLLAGAGIIGLALSFAFQNIASNFISGILIAVRHSYEVGDWITTQEVSGKVLQVSIYHTVILTDTGQHVVVPNKEVLEQPLINYSRTGKRQVELIVGISYTDDLDQVMEIAHSSLSSVNSLLKDEKTTLYYKEFDDFSINLEVNFWINFKTKRDHDIAVSDAIRAIKKAFDKNGIVIPYPIRTVELYNK